MNKKIFRTLMLAAACLIVTVGWSNNSQANAANYGQQGWQCGQGFNTTTFWYTLGSGDCLKHIKSLPASDQPSYKCDVLADTSGNNWDVLCTNKMGHTH